MQAKRRRCTFNEANMCTTYNIMERCVARMKVDRRAEVCTRLPRNAGVRP